MTPQFIHKPVLQPTRSKWRWAERRTRRRASLRDGFPGEDWIQRGSGELVEAELAPLYSSSIEKRTGMRSSQSHLRKTSRSLRKAVKRLGLGTMAWMTEVFDALSLCRESCHFTGTVAVPVKPLHTVADDLCCRLEWTLLRQPLPAHLLQTPRSSVGGMGDAESQVRTMWLLHRAHASLVLQGWALLDRGPMLPGSYIRGNKNFK